MNVLFSLAQVFHYAQTTFKTHFMLSTQIAFPLKLYIIKNLIPSVVIFIFHETTNNLTK